MHHFIGAVFIPFYSSLLGKSLPLDNLLRNLPARRRSVRRLGGLRFMVPFMFRFVAIGVALAYRFLCGLWSSHDTGALSYQERQWVTYLADWYADHFWPHERY